MSNSLIGALAWIAIIEAGILINLKAAGSGLSTNQLFEMEPHFKRGGRFSSEPKTFQTILDRMAEKGRVTKLEDGLWHRVES